MRATRALGRLSALLVAAGLAACSGSTAAPSTSPATQAPASQVAVGSIAASAAPSASPTESAAATESSGPAPSDGGGGKPTPGAIDPCSLLTADEASAAIGAKVGAGVTSDLDPDRVCTFGTGQTEVRLILAPPAPDAATAQAYWDAASKEIPAGVKIKMLSLFDRSAYGSATLGAISISALFAIDGTNFFDLFCQYPACSEAASVTAAKAIVGRLP